MSIRDSPYSTFNKLSQRRKPKKAKSRSMTKDETKTKLLQETISEVRSGVDLSALFGMAAHPDLQAGAHRGRRRFSKEPDKGV